MTIINEIIKNNAPLLEKRKKEMPLSVLEEMIAGNPKPLDFAERLEGESVKLIAEVKKASPSKGVICEGFNPVEIAGVYAKAGASAISVLTEELYFKGNIEYIRDIKKALPNLDVPILRKDFIFDPYQIYEARAYGADCLLIIAAMLSPEEIKELLELSHSLGMKCLFEVHNEKELEIALGSDAAIIGINNRNLENFEVSLSVTEALCRHIPKGKIIVSESGIKNASDVKRVKECGANAVLVGEALMKAVDMIGKIKELGLWLK